MHPDTLYLSLVEDVLHNGVRKQTRNGETLSVFGRQRTFDLHMSGFPLLTTKKMAWKSIVHELLWFLSGSSNVRPLMQAGVTIWDANAYDFYVKNCERYGHGKPPLPFDQWKAKVLEGGHSECQLPLGFMGWVYGVQWRDFNGEADEDDRTPPYCGDGPNDQISTALHKLRTDPDARDILVTAWDPERTQRNHVALPPCHVLFQFYTRPGVGGPDAPRFLDCQMVQRSCDLFLGVPFNIASYALLTHLVAATVGMKPGRFTHTYGDLHIYANHVAACEEQLKREPLAPPCVDIAPRDNIDAYTPDDITLKDYKSHPALKASMAV